MIGGFFLMYDDEEIEECYLESCVDVYEDSVTLNLPDMNSINMSDDELDTIFYHPELLFERVPRESAIFWAELIPHVFRVRQNKRDLYFDMGINFD